MINSFDEKIVKNSNFEKEVKEITNIPRNKGKIQIPEEDDFGTIDYGFFNISWTQFPDLERPLNYYYSFKIRFFTVTDRMVTSMSYYTATREAGEIFANAIFLKMKNFMED